MVILAVDPGTEQSAYVAFDGTKIESHNIVSNADFLDRLTGGIHWEDPVLVIEQIESFGMPVGKEIFATVFWTGRFAQGWWPRPHALLPRRVVKQYLCNSARATDANIRQALIDRFGPTTEKAVGKKATPGPLYGLKSHEFAALAVAVTYYDQQIAQTVPVAERIGF